MPNTTAESTDVACFLPLNPKDYLILFSLHEQDRHGYGIMKAIADQTEGSVRLDPANLHRSLKRMAKQGLVADADFTAASDAGGGRRRNYSVTALGRRVVVAEAARMRRLSNAAEALNLIPRSGA